jgi:hypothetical protein
MWLAVLLQANGMSSDMITRYLEGDLKEQLIPELGVTSRYAQITIGTEWGRKLIGEDLWANTWERGIADGESKRQRSRTVLTVRFLFKRRPGLALTHEHQDRRLHFRSSNPRAT